MRTFVALYRGKSVSKAQLIAVSVDHRLCQQVAEGILTENQSEALNGDAVAGAVLQGRREALRRIAGHGEEGGDDANPR